MKALPWVLVALLFISCATPRNSDRDTQIDYSGDFSRMQARMDSLMLNMQLVRKETSEKLSNLRIENKTVELSPPDSTGKQYPMRESTTTASKQERENTEVEESLLLTMQQFSNRLDTISNKVNVWLNQKETIVEITWWDLYKDKVYCCVIGIILIGWLAYKIRNKLLFC